MFIRYSIFANISKMLIYHFQYSFHCIDIVLQSYFFIKALCRTQESAHGMPRKEIQKILIRDHRTIALPPYLHDDEDEPDIDPQKQDPPSLVLAAWHVRTWSYMLTINKCKWERETHVHHLFIDVCISTYIYIYIHLFHHLFSIYTFIQIYIYIYYIHIIYL